jgi:hypothetical protein
VVRIVPHATSNQVSSGLCEMHSFAERRLHLWCSIGKTEANGAKPKAIGHTVCGGLSFALVLGIGPAVATAHKPSCGIYLSSLELACSGKSRLL